MKILFFFFLIPFTTNALTLNSIDFNKYKNFDKLWKLVTVRYRQDTEEMRFTYANPIAYNNLKRGVTDYPDGAVFAKIGVITGADPIFESSRAPLGARRIQFMVHNNKLYKSGHGWGYAIFDSNGEALPDDQKTTEDACIACHDAAKERGFVFSQDMSLSAKTTKSSNVGFNFKTELVSALPQNIKENISPKLKYYRKFYGDIAKNIFQGTLDEIRPTLSREVFNSKYPALIISEDNKRWSLVVPEQMGVNCDQKKKEGQYMKSTFTTSELGNETKNLHYCFTP
jgi:hypothetical protein